MRGDLRYTRINGVTIAYEIIGRGETDLVYLPGFTHNLEIVWDNPIYANFLERLGQLHRVILIDSRGSGLSDRFSPEDLPPLEVLAEDVKAVMDDVGSDQAAIFACGDSAPTSILFAATYPNRTLALLLWGPAIRGTQAPDFPWQWTEEEWNNHINVVENSWGTSICTEEIMGKYAPSILNNPQQLQWWGRFFRLSASTNTIIAIYLLLRETDVRSILPTISVPTIVMHRTDDQDEPIEEGRYAAKEIAGAHFLELPGTDSVPWTQDRERVANEITGFIRSIQKEESGYDRVLATTLFTDIVESTTRAATLGDAEWTRLLERHRIKVRALLKRYRGKEMDTAGDGFFAIFDGPARAVRCALAIVQTTGEEHFSIRAGLHIGEIELNANGTATGIAVHTGARICSIAATNEVFTSHTVRELVVGSGLEFKDAGTHQLKGIPGEWALSKAIGEGASLPNRRENTTNYPVS